VELCLNNHISLFCARIVRLISRQSRAVCVTCAPCLQMDWRRYEMFFVVGSEIYKIFFEHGIIGDCAIRFFFLVSGFKSCMWILVLCFCARVGNAYDRTLVVIVVNRLKPTGYVIHHQFNIQQLYALPTLYLCFVFIWEQTVTCATCSINLLVFYNRDEKCLLRGTDWVFK